MKKFMGRFRFLKKSLPYVNKHKKNFIIYVLLNLMLCVCGAILPLFTAQQLLKLTDGLFNQLINVSIIILIIEVLINVIRYFSRMNAQIFSREVLKDVQIDLANELMKIECKDLDKKSSGVFIDRLANDTGRIADIFIELNFSLVDIITNIGILFAIFLISKVMFLYFIISIIVVFLIERLRISKRIEIDKKYRKMAEEATGLIGELVRGIRDIKVLNAQSSFMNRVNRDITNLNKERYKMSSINRKYMAFADSVNSLIDFLLIFIGILLINNNYLTIANFVVIYMYKGKVFQLLYMISNIFDWYKDFELSATRVFEVIDNDVFVKEKFGKKHLKKVNGNFEFKNVSFAYNNKKQILKDVSFKVKKNETVAFVGKSGSGKTTIFSLLAKMYNIDQGEIKIDGVNINELDRDSIRGNISIITQNPYIFNTTIRDNLKLVKDSLSDKDMIKACKTACLHDFIMSLPDGYDTVVGEGGMTLSGGQRQRLAIARALVQKTEIILFDEATSALDNETQESIQNAINNMKSKYTILIIAHRLSTVINSDRIMVINDGKIETTGNHEYLLENNKYYKKLYNLELSKNR